RHPGARAARHTRAASGRALPRGKTAPAVRQRDSADYRRRRELAARAISLRERLSCADEEAGEVAPLSPLEPPDREHRRERRAELEGENDQPLSGLRWEPFDGEKRDKRHLSHHEELPDVCGGSLVGLTGSAEHRSVTNYDCKGGDRHCDRNEGTRPLEQ